MYQVEVFIRSRRAILGSFLFSVLFAVMQLSAFATASVTLAWNASTDPSVVGYNVYYGGASGAYTNELCAGNATNITISGLVQGTTYYFAATSYAASGLESSFSSEVSYLVPLNAPIVNQPPTLDPLNNLIVYEDAKPQKVDLSGITSGAAKEKQKLKITAVSDNPGLIPNPKISYTSPHTTGLLTFKPLANATGTAAITVTVNDGGASNNIVTQTFTVTVIAPPLPTFDAISDITVSEGASLQTTTVTGISCVATNESPKLKLIVKSSNPSLIHNPKVIYHNPDATATLTFKPVAKKTGITIITVTLEDSARKINNTFSRTFTITVLSNNVTGGPMPVTLESLGYANGQYALTVAVAPGYEPAVSGTTYVIEASTDLVNWVPVYTNTAPFTFVDTNASQFGQRFYRSVYAP